MDAAQFKLFKQITLDYFAKLAPDEAPLLDEPYLQFGDPTLFEYTSLVAVHGEYDGYIYLTSNEPLLCNLLELHGEPEISERTLRDMCQELSNVLSGNASQAFAGDWEISVPTSMVAADFNGIDLPETSFIMPISWRSTQFLLVVGLTCANGDLS